MPDAAPAAPNPANILPIITTAKHPKYFKKCFPTRSHLIAIKTNIGMPRKRLPSPQRTFSLKFSISIRIEKYSAAIAATAIIIVPRIPSIAIIIFY